MLIKYYNLLPYILFSVINKDRQKNRTLARDADQQINIETVSVFSATSDFI